MKDVMFFIGFACWVLWFTDTIYFTINNKALLPSRVWNVIHFLAITLVILSWYIV